MSSEKSPPCAICGRRVAVYTCPRCAIRSCSAVCSNSHKELQPCSGERDKIAFVPMNKYGWGTMANDYAYLEEVGRKAAEWGVDILKGGFLAEAALSNCGRGRGRGRGRRGQTTSRGNGGGKRDFLKLQLNARDIDMELLPPGMEKRRLNQSTWDAKSKSPLMTVEFVFHPPTRSMTTSAFSETPCFSILTHRNNLHLTVWEAISQHLLGRQKKDALPQWLQSLLPSPAGKDDEVQFDYIMAQPSQQALGLISKVFHKLKTDASLSTILCHKMFIEYPTIDIWAEGDFKGPLIDVDGTCMEAEEEIRPAKRRRVNVAGGRTVIMTLLGGYNSHDDEEEGQEEEENDEEDVLGMLGGYGTDEEQYVDVENLEKPTLENIREILEGIGNSSIQYDMDETGEEDGEELDWGDSGNEDEQLIRALEQQKASFRPG